MHMNHTDHKTVSVTVAIPCYNAVGTIGKTLEAVLAQETSFDFEVLVVDSSDDGTTELIRTQFPEVRLIHLAHQTLPGSGRNLGVREARGEIVVFTDSDCVPEPGWLQGHADAHRTLDCEAVGGSVINGYPRNYVAWVSHLIEFNEWTKKSPEGFVRNNPSCNLSFKRESFFRLRFEFTDNFPNEDTLLNWQLLKAGGRIYFRPDLAVVHLNRMQFRKLFQHQHRLGRAVAVERRITDLPGKIFLRFPPLCLGLPLVRWALALARLVRIDLRQTLVFLWITPLFLAAALAWSFGFMAGGTYREAEISIFDPEKKE